MDAMDGAQGQAPKRKRYTLEERYAKLSNSLNSCAQDMHALKLRQNKVQRKLDTRLKIHVGAEFMKFFSVKTLDEARKKFEALYYLERQSIDHRYRRNPVDEFAEEYEQLDGA
jgi:hypothetical protein